MGLFRNIFKTFVVRGPKKNGDSLLAGPEKREISGASNLTRVAGAHRLSPLAQLGHLIRGLKSRNGMLPQEYYDFELFSQCYDAAARAEFVGVKGSRRINRALSPASVRMHDRLISDKVLLTGRLSDRGMATTKTQAVVDAVRSFGATPVLRTPQDICVFLKDDAVYPLFAKPSAGSLSIGSALITGLEEGGTTLALADGRKVALADFADEIIKAHAATGFVFQTAVRQHGKLTEMAGPALSTVRVVTVTEEADAPHVLYALWKLPAPGAMSDNFWQPGAMLCQLDLASGEVCRVRRGLGFDTELLVAHPVTGHRLVGEVLPFWQDIKSIASSGHAEFPDSGVLGWDIGVTDTGPAIIECNVAPFHTLYQLATGQGLLNTRFASVFAKIAERQSAHRKLRGNFTA